MGKRGPKPQFINVACPNKYCKLYGLTDQGNIIGNGTYISRGEKIRKYIFAITVAKHFTTIQTHFIMICVKRSTSIDLALKMSMKGMSIERLLLMY